MSQIGSPVITPSCTSWAFDILTQCLNISILRNHRSSKVWTSTIALASCALHPRSSKTAFMLACIISFLSFLYLGSLTSLGRISLDKNDHPELDISEILEGDMAAKYLTMVGQLQWLVTLARFDIHAQVATMSRYRAAPRQGHMDRLKRIYSYAIRTKDYAIWFRTDQPDYSFLPDQDFDWTYSGYGNVQKSFLMTCQNHLVRQ